MTNLNLPKINSKNGSTKDNIIKIISQKQPLSAKEIHNRLKREYAATVSYQAAHKMLGEMMKEEILKKNGEGYKINKEWIQKIKKYSENLENIYEKGEQIDFRINNYSKIIFNKYIEFCRFLVHEFLLATSSKEPGICFWRHVIAPYGINEKDHEALKVILNSEEHYALCKNNTFLDNWFSNYLQELGKKCFNGIEYSTQNDLYIQRDLLMQLFFKPAFNKKIDLFYKKVKQFKDFKPSEYLELLNEKTEITAIIVRDKELTDAFRREAIRIIKTKE